jgi:hypothetical protein
MQKLAKKRSSDPAQQQLRETKDAWNGNVRSFTKELSALRNNIRLFNSNLIEYKKLINGYPNVFYKQKGDIKYPIPVNTDQINSQLSDNFSGIVQKLSDLSSKFNDLAQKSSSIVAQQAQYSQTRKKKKGEENKIANDTSYLLVSDASTPFSRFFSGIVNPIFNREDWARRKSWLDLCLSLKKNFRHFDYLILGTDADSVKQANDLFRNIIWAQVDALSSSINRYYEKVSSLSDDKEEKYDDKSSTDSTSNNKSSNQSKKHKADLASKTKDNKVEYHLKTPDDEAMMPKRPSEGQLPSQPTAQTEPDIIPAEAAFINARTEWKNAFQNPDQVNFKNFLLKNKLDNKSYSAVLQEAFENIFEHFDSDDRYKSIPYYNNFVETWSKFKTEWQNSQALASIDYELQKYGQYYVQRFLRKLRHKKPIIETGVDAFSINRLDLSEYTQNILNSLNDMMDSLESGLDIAVVYNTVNEIKKSCEDMSKELSILMRANLTEDQINKLKEQSERKRLLEYSRQAL